MCIRDRLAGVAGIIFSSRLISASPDAGRNTAFDVVTAVLMGGTSINGGQGNILGTMLGILTVSYTHLDVYKRQVQSSAGAMQGL